MEDAQVLLFEDDVGRLARHVRRRHDGDADVSRVQGWRVVDPVAHESDDVAAALQREDDPILLRRRHAREDRRFFGHVAKGRIVQARDVLAGDDVPIVDRDRRDRRDGRRDRCLP